MHMSDVLIIPSVGAVMYVASGIVTHRSVVKTKVKAEQGLLPMMGVLGAFVFAAQMINFSIPGTGSSGHIGGSLLLTAILGPYPAFLTMIGILTIQALMFADGGILALGCNIWNMAFYGCFVGGFVVWKPLMGKSVSKQRIMVVSIIAGILTLQLGAFSVVLQTGLSGITELPFWSFALLMQLIHFVIGIVEGVVTGLILLYVYEVRPERIWLGQDESVPALPARGKVVLARVFFLGAIILGGAISLVASADPDGLEWAIGRIGAENINGAITNIHGYFESLQQQTAILPDYAFKGSESPLGTVIGGVAGVLLLTLVGLGIGAIMKRTRRS